MSLTPDNLAGLNVAGYFTSESGVGEAARGYITAIKQLNIDLAIYDAKGTPHRKLDRTFTDFSIEKQYPVNLICVNADAVEHFINDVGYKFVDGKINIGFWWWELPKFPDKWKYKFDYFDQIWVGTEFARKTVQAASPIPVVRIPPVVKVNLKHRYSRSYYGISKNEYLFLFIFDFYSVFERKNPLDIVRAFKLAFNEDEPVRLILKCINDDSDPQNMKLLEQEISGARVNIINEYFSKDEKNGLLAVADCYVSLHRSEGFGFPLAESMYLAKPVIATGWSGNTDFMTSENSYLVNYTLKQLESDFGPYDRGEIWADPDINHAASLMRHVYENQEEAREIGKKNHSEIMIAKQIRDRLDEVPKEKTYDREKQIRVLIFRIKILMRLFWGRLKYSFPGPKKMKRLLKKYRSKK